MKHTRPFSSTNFTDKLVSPIQTGQWLCCHATNHDNQSVILSRSLTATQLLVPPPNFFYSLVSTCMSVILRDPTVSTSSSHEEQDRLSSLSRRRLQHQILGQGLVLALFFSRDETSLGVVVLLFLELFPCTPCCNGLSVTTCS